MRFLLFCILRVTFSQFARNITQMQVMRVKKTIHILKKKDKPAT